MAHDVVMPRLGWTMEVGTVVEWLKRDGDPVEAGDAIFSVDSDKAVTEVEALDSGILHIPAGSPIGVEVHVGALLASILLPGEVASSNDAHAPSRPPVADSAPDTSPRGGPADRLPVAATGNGQTAPAAISPRARRIAHELGIDWHDLVGSGISGRIRERDIRAAARVRSSTERRRATPTVRRLAEETGITLDRLTTIDPGGRVTRADILAAAAVSPAVETEPEVVSALTPMRRVILERMTESARTVAPVTLTTDADATELVRIRQHLKEELDGTASTVPSYTDLIVRISALALLDHPAVNASLTDAGIVRHDRVHLGIAVDTERGLLVPVIRDADRSSIHRIAAESSRLIDRVQTGSITSDDLRGGTFTVTNLGMFDIDAFTPIVNLPECAILGLGRIVARPVVIDPDGETIAVRNMIALSLTFDHRIVDGAPAARFLQQIKRMIERPYTWLTR